LPLSGPFAAWQPELKRPVDLLADELQFAQSFRRLPQIVSAFRLSVPPFLSSISGRSRRRPARSAVVKQRFGQTPEW